VDRLTRKELKTDRFAVEVGHTLDFLTTHRQQVIRYGIIAAVVVVAALAVYLFTRHQRGARQQALVSALRIYQAPIGSGEPGSYATQGERDKAVAKAFTGLAGRYSGSDEAAVAQYYLGTQAGDQGRLADAEKAFRMAADSGHAGYASMARLALAEIYAGQGKLAEAEKLLRSLMEKPTLFVSREQATIELARLLAPTRPAEARKLLEPLRTHERSAVSRAALTYLNSLPAQ
jgi:predicted negative regulator of RcsB-dependent stress response